jgi:hypothetical protein
MSEVTFAKATLLELKQDLVTPANDKSPIKVQFNPDSLKVTYANEIKQPESGDQSSGTAGRQFVGSSTTKLALTLWFDVTVVGDTPIDDVRKLTSKITYFMDPKPTEDDPAKKMPPGVRFQWGSFIFNGMVEGLEETIEFFSPEGKPLRASISLTLSQQKILVSAAEANNAKDTTFQTGQRPYAAAKQGDSIQDMAIGAGKPGGWQDIAAANRIEDPLRMKPGAMIDLNAKVSVPSGFGAAASLGGGVRLGAAANINIGANVQGGVKTPPLPRLGLN